MVYKRLFTNFRRSSKGATSGRSFRQLSRKLTIFAPGAERADPGLGQTRIRKDSLLCSAPPLCLRR